MLDSVIRDWLEQPPLPVPWKPLAKASGGEAASESMWALLASQSRAAHYKLIMSLPTFSGRAHLPTHALHYYVQEDKRNKRWTELDLEAGGVGVRNSMLLKTLRKLKARPRPTPQNRLEILIVMNVNDSEHLHHCSICGPTK